MIKSLPNNGFKLITCVLYRNYGTGILKKLHKRGINAVSLHHARGSAIGDPVGKNGLPASFEKEIVTVVVPTEIADEIFEFIFNVAEIDRPYGGFLYMASLKSASPYVLDNTPDETI